jgi:hypothetical protein
LNVDCGLSLWLCHTTECSTAIQFGHIVPEVAFLILSVGIDSSSLPAEQQEELKFRFKGQVLKRLKQKLYYWRPVEYNEYRALLYMVARFAPEYTVLHRIFMELKTREPNFQPHSLFDFGSGVGTATW